MMPAVNIASDQHCCEVFAGTSVTAETQQSIKAVAQAFCYGAAWQARANAKKIRNLRQDNHNMRTELKKWRTEHEHSSNRHT